MGNVIYMSTRKGKTKRPHVAFGRRLMVLIEEANYPSIRAFAEAIGEKDENTVSRWTRGETMPRPHKFPIILTKLGIMHNAARLLGEPQRAAPEPSGRKKLISNS